MKKCIFSLLFIITSFSFGQYSWSSSQIKVLEAVNFWTFTTTATAPSGNVYAAYFLNSADINGQNRTIEVQRWNGSAWNLITSFTASNAGLSTFSDDLSIAIDQNEHIHLAFKGYTGSGMTSNRGVSYGYYNGTAWSFANIEYHSDPSGWQNCENPIIKVNSSNIPIILYEFSNANAPKTYYIKAAIKNSSWSITTVQQGSIQLNLVDLLIKSSGLPAVVYLKVTSATDDIVTESYNGTSWTESAVATVEHILGGTQAAISSSDVIYIAYEHWIQSSSTDKLVLYNNSGGTWTAEDLFSSTSVYYYIYELLVSGGSNLILQYTTQNSSTYAYDPKKFMLKEGPAWVSYTMTISPSIDNVSITADNQKNILMVYGNDLSVRPRTLSYVIGNYTDPLPVEMHSFSANEDGNSVILKWKTSTEVNNSGFEIERKQQESPSWQKIGFIQGNGNSASPKEYSFADKSPLTGAMMYRLKQTDNDGTFKYYDPVNITVTAPKEFRLMQNSPNPFNPVTAIRFQLPVNSSVNIEVFDILGRKVTTLINEEKPAGSYILYWNGRDLNEKSVPSGIYLYKLTAGSYTETRRMNLLK